MARYGCLFCRVTKEGKGGAVAMQFQGVGRFSVCWGCLARSGMLCLGTGWWLVGMGWGRRPMEGWDMAVLGFIYTSLWVSEVRCVLLMLLRGPPLMGSARRGRYGRDRCVRFGL